MLQSALKLQCLSKIQQSDDESSRHTSYDDFEYGLQVSVEKEDTNLTKIKETEISHDITDVVSNSTCSRKCQAESLGKTLTLDIENAENDTYSSQTFLNEGITEERSRDTDIMDTKMVVLDYMQKGRATAENIEVHESPHTEAEIVKTGMLGTHNLLAFGNTEVDKFAR